MPARPATVPGPVAIAGRAREPGPSAAPVRSFRRALLAEDKSPATVCLYVGPLDLFGACLADRGMPLDVEHIRREHVETFLIAEQARGQKPASVAARYRAL